MLHSAQPEGPTSVGGKLDWPLQSSSARLTDDSVRLWISRATSSIASPRTTATPLPSCVGHSTARAVPRLGVPSSSSSPTPASSFVSSVQRNRDRPSSFSLARGDARITSHTRYSRLRPSTTAGWSNDCTSKSRRSQYAASSGPDRGAVQQGVSTCCPWAAWYRSRSRSRAIAAPSSKEGSANADEAQPATAVTSSRSSTWVHSRCLPGGRRPAHGKFRRRSPRAGAQSGALRKEAMHPRALQAVESGMHWMVQANVRGREGGMCDGTDQERAQDVPTDGGAKNAGGQSGVQGGIQQELQVMLRRGGHDDL